MTGPISVDMSIALDGCAIALVLTIAVLGGRLVGAVAAVLASQLTNWFFVPPLHRFTIAEGSHLVALVVFVAVAIVVGWLVDSAAQRASEARRARAEAEALARGAASLATNVAPLPRLAEHIRAAFDLDAVRVLRRDGEDSVTVGVVGTPGSTAVVSIPIAAGRGPRRRRTAAWTCA